MNLSSEFEVIEIEGSFVAVPIGNESNREGKIIRLNETAMLLFSFLKNGSTQDEMTNALVDNYNVVREDAVKDVDNFLSVLRASGFLK